MPAPPPEERLINCRLFHIQLAGPASYYLLEGQIQANGKKHRGHRMTAATWPRIADLGDTLVLTRVDTGRRVKVVVEDRFGRGDPRERVADVSRAAADRMQMWQKGVVQVRVEVRRRSGKRSRDQ